MKKIVFMLALLSGAAVSSLAQQNNHTNGQNHNQKGGEQHPQGQKMTTEQKAAKLTQYMTTSLSLTADQQSKVAALNTSKAKQVDSIRTKYKGDMETAKPALKTTKDQYNTSLNGILTADQKTKWDAIKKQKTEEYQKNKAAGAKPKEGELSPEDIE